MVLSSQPRTLMFFSKHLVAILFLVLWPVGKCINFSYPSVFNFGDSNSDTGGLVAGIAFPVGNPNGQTYFLKPSGRFCDGRLIIDFLSEALDLPFLNPYLDSVGAPNFRAGCNFATGGSTVLPANAASDSPFSFGVQVSQFLRFKARVTELLSKGKERNKYLPPKDNFAQGLYTIDIGQNDLDGAFYSKSEDQVVAFIPTIISELEAGIKKLYFQGARRFWVHNTGPLGCLPRIIAAFGKDPSNVDEFGCVSSHNRAAKLFNLQLHTLCQGFKHPIQACCGYGGDPLNYDSRIQCGQTKILNGTSVTASPCSNSSDYVNWDGNHYTESANLYISSQILTGNYFEPPLHYKMPFFLKFSL